MTRIVDLAPDKARAHFLKGGCYFRDDIAKYLSFEPILNDAASALGAALYRGVMVSDKSKWPENLPGVNYSFTANKDGRFAWRPYELIHPVIYVSLINVITDPNNWALIQKRFEEFGAGIVDCCSAPVLSDDHQTDTAAQVMSWWLEFEQKTLIRSLEFSHLLHSDVTDCYGSLYTHSIAWALHGIEKAKEKKADKELLGNIIDKHIQHSRYGQTNGITQGSVLMDFIAEIVLGFVDFEIGKQLNGSSDICILRYRDDYRILANSDHRAYEVLKVVSDSLRVVGMKLGVAKTFLCENVVEGAVKPDKLAGIELQDMDIAHAKTIQKQLLRLHAFARRFPNSGALRRLAAGAHEKVISLKEPPDDIWVQAAIVTDIAVLSPQAFPALAGMLSHLLSLVEGTERKELWTKTLKKLKQVPYNGYLEIWLQRVTKSKDVAIPLESDEAICQIVNGHAVSLWQNGWIDQAKYPALTAALHVAKIVVDNPTAMPPVIDPTEIQLFAQHAYAY